MTLGRIRLGAIHGMVALILMLGAGLAWLWVDQTGRPRNINWVAPAALAPDLKAMPTATGAAVAPLLSAASILERPVFAPDRRPPPPPVEAPPDPFASIKLVGIFSGANAGVLARIDGQVKRVKVNEGIGSWTLKSVEGRNATFLQGNDSRQVSLAYAPLGLPAPQPVPGAAPTGAMNAAPSSMALPQSVQDEARDRLRRRNELRASRGFPPLTE